MIQTGRSLLFKRHCLLVLKMLTSWTNSGTEQTSKGHNSNWLQTLQHLRKHDVYITFVWYFCLFALSHFPLTLPCEWVMNYLPRSLHRVINWKVYILYAESPQTYHHVNESGEAPESIYFVLHDDKYWCQKITHALNVPCSNQTTWWSPHCAVIPDDDETESPVSHRRTQWSQTTSLTLLPYHITLCCDHRRRWDRESSVTQKNTLVSDYQSHTVTIPHHTTLTVSKPFNPLMPTVAIWLQI